MLSSVKLIAEPWDIGMGGYQVGGFPPGWSEWNGKYRDTVRKFWKGDEGQLADFASRVSGSADLYDQRGRRTWASVNFVTAHDGFTLRDLVSYDGKHNEANKEDNRDGADDNNSWNCGAEGPTDHPEIQQLRRQQMRNFLATLLLSQGVPMLLAGDEFTRTQGGNNNGYCQDSEISWIDWEMDDEGKSLLEFTRQLIALRREHIVFHRNRFFRARAIPGTDITDVSWLRPDGEAMAADDWGDGHAKAVALLLSGEAGLIHLTDRGEPEADDTFLMLVNASHEDVAFALPAPEPIEAWHLLINTAVDPGLRLRGPARSRKLVHGAGAIAGAAGARQRRRLRRAWRASRIAALRQVLDDRALRPVVAMAALGQANQRPAHAGELCHLAVEVGDPMQRQRLDIGARPMRIAIEIEQLVAFADAEAERSRPLHEAQHMDVALAVGPIAVAGARRRRDQPDILVVADGLGGDARAGRRLADVHGACPFLP